MNLAPDGGFRVMCVPHCCAGPNHNSDKSSGTTRRRDFYSFAVCFILWVGWSKPLLRAALNPCNEAAAYLS